MKTFHEIVLDNPKAGELAMELVFEALTGECWHDRGDGKWTGLDTDMLCAKCLNRFYVWEGKNPATLVRTNTNPDLLESLDAWIPLWERMSDYQIDRMHDMLTSIVCGNAFLAYSWLAKPHHHVEAALRTLEVECPECRGDGVLPDYEMPDPIAKVNIGGTVKSCTCGTGKQTLYELWKEKSQ